MPESFPPPPPKRHPSDELGRRLSAAWAPIQATWSRLGAWTAPYRTRIAQILAPVTGPLGRLLAPVNAQWRVLTAPLRRRWQHFADRSPRTARVLSAAGFVLRWGFYFLLFLIFGVWIGLFGALPSSEELRNIETANAGEIYTADSVLIGRFYRIENRTSVALDRISPHVINALVATEDQRFFEHSGIDIQSWFRVAFGVVTGKESLGGGSTLSQQLAKNLYKRKNYYIPGVSIIINKIRENFISVRLERIYTKEELLSLYLNTVPFGGDVFGVGVAARQYFNKKPKDLTPDQAATLIGMLKATSRYHPVRNPNNAQKRRNVVLQQMVKNGHLSPEEYETLSKKPVGAKYYGRDGHSEGLGTYFREHLRTDVLPKLLKELSREDGTPYDLYTDGLKIYTTLDSKMQQYAEEAVQRQMSDLQKLFDQHWKNFKKEKPWGDDKWINEQVRRSDRWQTLKDAGVSEADALANFEQPVRMTVFSWKNGGGDIDTTMTPLDSVRYYFCMLNCGFMTMEHRTGYVRAWVGGTNFKYFKYDHILSRRQVGSTFKPIVYAAALQDSIKPCDYLPNEITKIEDWEPHNADETYGGWYSVNAGLQKSVNVIAAQLIQRVGIQKTLDLAKQMGVTATLPREFGISLGAADISLYDMMKVYGTLANKGVRPDPVTVLKITTRTGEVIYDHTKELEKNPEAGPHVRAMTENQAATMTRMLQNVVDYGTGARLRSGYGIQGDFAGKTGTTQNHSDGWFICYNPEYVTGAWVGAPSPAVRFRYMALGQGSAMALPIAGHFWHKMANDRKFARSLRQKFPEPAPEVVALFGCYPWIDISPDTFRMLMQDSTLRDSIRVYYTQRSDKDGDDEVGEAPTEADKKAAEEAKRRERREKRKEFFDKLFNRKPEEEEGG